MGPQPLGHGYRVIYDGSSHDTDTQVSMGPQPLGHGYCPLTSLTPKPSASFNGATTSRSWIRCRSDDEGVRERWVSMGPQPLGHGYADKTGKSYPAFSGFNGATTSRSWIPALCQDSADRSPGRFQWGHNLSVMDTASIARYSSQWSLVSMGPQPLGHGYIVNFIALVSMGPQPLGHGYSSQMHDFVSRSLSFDENATILHLPSRVALRFPSPFCTFDSRFCERSPFERHFSNVLSHT